ncbi:hypothetical protein CF319_g6910, partial [Tilletia indica]
MSSSTRSQASLLQETLDVALARLQALEDAQAVTTRENLELRQRLEVQGPLQPPPAVPHSNPREPKTQSARFPDDDTKINYAVSFLRDDAMAWVEPFASKTPEEQPAFMKSYHLFIKELKTIFGDPDEVATAERNIRLLRQRGPASTYFADFRRYAAVLDWNDSALASQAYVGLKDPIKDELARTGRPDGLDQLIEICTRIDNRLHERQVERERPVTTTRATTTTTTNNSNYNNNNYGNNDSPTIQVSSPSFISSPANALLDTAATRNYLDVEFSHRHSLPLTALLKPIPVIYADGSSGHELITHTTTLQIALPSGPQHRVTFYVTPLRSHDLFLGLPWFQDCVATLDFGHLRLTFSVVSPTPSNTSEPSVVSSAPLNTSEPSVVSSTPLNISETPVASSTTLNNTTTFPDLPEVSLSASQRRDVLDATHSFPSLPVPPEQARQLSTSEDTAIRASLPETYHDYVDVFRKSSAHRLPEPRHYDHKIPLQPDTTPPCGPIYSLSEGEHQELRNYLKENLDKGFIRPSSSPAGAPVLFVPKPDGTFRMCVDYRGINNITVKDRYAIPK